jgi:hypothetical protein
MNDAHDKNLFFLHHPGYRGFAGRAGSDWALVQVFFNRRGVAAEQLGFLSYFKWR